MKAGRLAGIAAALLLSACGLFDSNTRVIPPLKDPVGLRGLTARWHVDLGDGGRVPLAPAVADGRVFAARSDGDVLAIDAVSGQTVWKTSVRAVLSGGVGAGQGSVVVGTREGALIAFDQDGRQRWQVPTGGGEISAAPLIGEGIVVARTGDGKLVGLALDTGAVRWTVERGLPALTLYRATSALISRGAVFAGLPGGKLLALTATDGKVGWEAAVAVPRGATELERVADVTGSPVAGERDICAATYQGRVACLDPANGNALWSRDASTVSGLGADASRVFVADEKGVINAWERGSGAPAWKNDDFSGRRLVGALAAGGLVVTGDLQGYVHWLDRDDGKVLARASTDGSTLNQQPLFLGDGVLVQTRKGGLYAFPMP